MLREVSTKYEPLNYSNLGTSASCTWRVKGWNQVIAVGSAYPGHLMGSDYHRPWTSQAPIMRQNQRRRFERRTIIAASVGVLLVAVLSADSDSGAYLDHVLQQYREETVNDGERRNIEEMKATLKPRPKGFKSPKNWTTDSALRLMYLVQENKVTDSVQQDLRKILTSAHSTRPANNSMKFRGTEEQASPIQSLLQFDNHLQADLPSARVDRKTCMSTETPTVTGGRSERPGGSGGSVRSGGGGKGEVSGGIPGSPRGSGGRRGRPGGSGGRRVRHRRPRRSSSEYYDDYDYGSPEMPGDSGGRPSKPGRNGGSSSEYYDDDYDYGSPERPGGSGGRPERSGSSGGSPGKPGKPGGSGGSPLKSSKLGDASSEYYDDYDYSSPGRPGGSGGRPRKLGRPGGSGGSPGRPGRTGGSRSRPWRPLRPGGSDNRPKKPAGHSSFEYYDDYDYSSPEKPGSGSRPRRPGRSGPDKLPRQRW
ncbi:unnamed protein product [Arctia plantaginis]|uniref:Uncharacterized protein n=1 Tax=Arctia plantaginis TaxID=874455 RepID=A0A8S0ZI24_ARCPL|nr:unnamed protein product [Arctia plantaginis]